MLIQTRVLGEPSTAVFHRANVRLFARVYPYVVLVIRRTGESFAAHRLSALVRPFTGMRPHVNLERREILIIASHSETFRFITVFMPALLYLPNIARGERSTTAIEWTVEGTFPRVSPYVLQEIAGGLEALGAHIGQAFVWFLTCVRP